MDSEMRGNEGFPDGVDYNSREVWTHENRRVIMASLVEDVYKIANGRPRLQCFPYDMVKPIEAKGSVFGAVYKSRLDHDLSAPNIVVAFRGTILTNEADHTANIHIYRDILRSHERYDVGLEVLKEQVEEYGHSKVCLAGHSQGAALALLMGRELAEGEGRRFLEAHLFNPPHPGFARPETYHTRPSLFTSIYKALLNVCWQLHQEERTRKDKFLSIRDWLPHLYINAHDVITSAYITHFLPQLLTGGYPRSFRGIFRPYALETDDSWPDHLIPSACLHLNVRNRSASNCLIERYNAHKLNQWFDLNLQVYPPLIVQFDPEMDCMVIVR